ncbi:uncharacterized protein LOC26535956 isoform X1 [Drosophila yakuba]|uniref:uncharacterized protein LOC26535956 isoform X1 n=1 Tax=Drosophila yakuba TaxID=7245 RepID=UPI0019307BB9|nr:uncharacterized protein LOC26535956 isoform X1 [Drosophila yakuba]
MVPISSSKLNRKLASRALTKEAGILFYSLMNEDCRESSRNIMNIIGLKKHQNLNKNATLILETAEIKTEDKELSTIGTQETPDEFNTADNSSIVSSP